MQCPTLSHRSFAILGALIETGGELMFSELHARACAETDESNLCGLLRRLVRDRLIVRDQIRPAQPIQGKAWLPRVRITPAGRETYRDVLDWYLCAAERFGKAPAPAERETDGRGTVDARPSLRAGKPIASRGRTLSRIDEQRLAAVATPQFWQVYTAVRIMPAFLNEITSLQIAHVDLAGGRLTIRSQRHGATAGIPDRVLSIDGKLRRLLKAAIGSRKSGPVFVSRRGAWNPANLGNEFRRTARLAGLPDNLEFVGQRRFLDLCASLGITPRVKRKNGWGTPKR